VRKTRKINVIINGLPEPSAEDSVERETDDLGLVRTVLQAVKCHEMEVGQVVGLGKRPESTSHRQFRVTETETTETSVQN